MQRSVCSHTSYDLVGTHARHLRLNNMPPELTSPDTSTIIAGTCHVSRLCPALLLPRAFYPDSTHTVTVNMSIAASLLKVPYRNG